MKTHFAKILALLLCGIMLFAAAGCTPAQLGETTGTPDTDDANATAPPVSPTEILPDVPADRYDATVTPRTGANASMPLVRSEDTLDGKFSPFFYTSAPDGVVVDYTQLLLLTTDKTGALVAGIDKPSFAYDYSQEISEDKSTSTYRMILKNGITFSDGVPVTVKDVLFSMYVECDPLYDATATFYTMKIRGLQEYRMQASAQTLEEAAAIREAGFSLDENGQMVFPSASGITAEQQAAYWAPLPEMGATFAQEIIDYVLAARGSDEYAKKIGETLTWASFDTDSKKAAFAMKYWNLGTLTADMIFTDAMGKVYDLNTLELTAADCWNAMIALYNFNVEDVQAESAGSKILADALTMAYAKGSDTNAGVESISGITSGKMICDDGVERDYVEVVCDGIDPSAIYKFNMYVVPWHYYTEGFTGEMNQYGVSVNDPEFIRCLKDKNSAPMGAGPYKFIEYKDNVVYYTANDSFLLGSPKIQTLRIQELTLGAQLDSILTDTVHFTDPSASTDIINDITAGEGDYGKLAYLLVDNDGYGYIGMNAQAIPEWDVRKAIAHAMNVQLTIDDYYGELATVNYRTKTKVSWAYPENPECLFPYDGTGETSKALFLKAGYIYDEAKNIMYYPEGHAKAGQQVTFKATLPAAAADHPAGTVFVDMQEVLAKIGVKMDIEVDENVLDKLNIAYEAGVQIWTAAWQKGGVNPDMFQIWYSDPALNQSSSPMASGLYWLYANGSVEEKTHLKRLNELIMAARATLDFEERKVIYKEALKLSTGIATEVPTYQRKNMFVYNKEVIDGSTLFSGEDLTPFQGPIDYIWNVELLG